MESPVRESNLAQKLDPMPESDKPVLTAINGGQSNIIDPLDEVSFRKTKRQHIREFGAVIALALVLFAGLKLYKGGNLNTVLVLCTCGALFGLLCAWAPALMNPVFKGWMRIGSVLEIITTRILLGALWFATFFPLGIIFRMIGKSTMTLGFEPNRSSYWEDCKNGRNDFKLLERQY